MRIIIPYRQYTVRLRQNVLRHSQCPKCNCAFAYVRKLSVRGGGSSLLYLDNAGAAERAKRRAQAAMEKKIQTLTLPEVCPQCMHIRRTATLGSRIVKTIVLMIAGFFFSLLVGVMLLAAGRQDSMPGPTVGGLLIEWLLLLMFLSMIFLPPLLLVVNVYHFAPTWYRKRLLARYGSQIIAAGNPDVAGVAALAAAGSGNPMNPMPGRTVKRSRANSDEPIPMEPDRSEESPENNSSPEINSPPVVERKQPVQKIASPSNQTAPRPAQRDGQRAVGTAKSDKLQVRCGACGKAFLAPRASAGKRAKCNQCGEAITIPAS